ncbi:Hsp20/alpha crystallin family protein [Synechococcus sp. UW140]|uniref:Hsp20/alpha crystallin family protein n=1 Tax=Synechococcus sp. UW140 TaxID=368503 RepID=UPI000E0FCF28|nr:Hsp20/alpha crystallin family protein [Synechococcus sp. UW140]
MITLRQSPFDLLERLEQQVAQAERVPAAEVLEHADGYTVRLELPGVDRNSIDVKATDRTLVISAERHASLDPAIENNPQQLLSEFRPGNWSRSFRFSQPLDRDQLRASYRDGILEIQAAKAENRTTVSVTVES